MHAVVCHFESSQAAQVQALEACTIDDDKRQREQRFQGVDLVAVNGSNSLPSSFFGGIFLQEALGPVSKRQMELEKYRPAGKGSTLYCSISAKCSCCRREAPCTCGR